MGYLIRKTMKVMKRAYDRPECDVIEMSSMRIMVISDTEISDEDADEFDLPVKRELESPIWCDPE